MGLILQGFSFKMARLCGGMPTEEECVATLIVRGIITIAFRADHFPGRDSRFTVEIFQCPSPREGSEDNRM